jgi:hypothetical protein
MFLAGAWASWGLIHWAVREGYYEIKSEWEPNREAIEDDVRKRHSEFDTRNIDFDH